MSLFRITPKKPIEVEIVSDLDRLISKPIGFKLHGKNHAIKPMSTEHFLVVSNELGKIDAMMKKARVTDIAQDEIVEKYFKMFSSCVDTLEKDDLNKMTYPQIAALFQLILDCVNGKAQVESEKKNLIQTQTSA